MNQLIRFRWADARRWHAEGWWREVTVPSLIADASMRRPDGLAVIDGDLRLSWSQLRAATGRLAARLDSLEVDRGDMVVLWVRDSALLIVAMAAVQAVQAIAIPVSASTGTAELQRIVSRTDARAVLADTELTDRGIRVPTTVKLDLELWSGEDAPLPPPDYYPDADAVSDIMFTSGTTGLPKGPMNSANTKLAGLRGLLAEFPFSTEDVWGQIAPMTHNAGWLYTVLPALATTACVVVVGRGDSARMLDTLTREKVTATFLVPTHLQDLLTTWRADSTRWPLSLRYVLTGAAAAGPELVRALAEDWGVTPISMYGLTECQASLFTRNTDPIAEITVSVGTPCPGSEVALRDVATGEIGNAEGSVGEIVTRGPTTFLGYFDDQSATSATFTKDGWLRTGDLGTIQRGRFSVVGRLKEIILRGGATVSPQDVEQALCTYPGIPEVAVIGIPDERLGERICGCILGSEIPALEAVRSHLEQAGFGRSLWPDELVAIERFPRTDLGKIKRPQLREGVLRMQSRQARPD